MPLSPSDGLGVVWSPRQDDEGTLGSSATSQRGLWLLHPHGPRGCHTAAGADL